MANPSSLSPAPMAREGGLIHDGEMAFLKGCPRGRDDCVALARVSSPKFASFMCCGETDAAPVPTDRLRFCMKSTHKHGVDVMVNLDERDATDTASVLLSGMSSLAAAKANESLGTLAAPEQAEGDGAQPSGGDSHGPVVDAPPSAAVSPDAPLKISGPDAEHIASVLNGMRPGLLEVVSRESVAPSSHTTGGMPHKIVSSHIETVVAPSPETRTDGTAPFTNTLGGVDAAGVPPEVKKKVQAGRQSAEAQVTGEDTGTLVHDPHHEIGVSDGPVLIAPTSLPWRKCMGGVHGDTPYIFGGETDPGDEYDVGRLIGAVNTVPDADYIVTACNAYPALCAKVEQLARVVDALAQERDDALTGQSVNAEIITILADALNVMPEDALDTESLLDAIHSRETQLADTEDEAKALRERVLRDEQERDDANEALTVAEQAAAFNFESATIYKRERDENFERASKAEEEASTARRIAETYAPTDCTLPWTRLIGGEASSGNLGTGEQSGG